MNDCCAKVHREMVRSLYPSLFRMLDLVELRDSLPDDTHPALRKAMDQAVENALNQFLGGW